MSETAQNYSNHVRRHPPFHFFLVPVMTIHLVWTIVRLVKTPSWNNAEQLLLACGLIVLLLLVRTYALKVQNRVIRLEAGQVVANGSTEILGQARELTSLGAALL